MSTTPSIITQFFDYYAELETQPPSALAALYHPEATLIDPFGKHQGLAAIQRYFANLLTHVEHCHFAIDSPLCQEDRFSVTWNMHWSHPLVAKGKTLQLPGCSVVEIEYGLIIRQRDYYDAGAMLYEHLPLLGWAVRRVKTRLLS